MLQEAGMSGKGGLTWVLCLKCSASVMMYISMTGCEATGSTLVININWYPWQKYARLHGFIFLSRKIVENNSVVTCKLHQINRLSSQLEGGPVGLAITPEPS
jgi:hypothetical protein